MKIKQSVALSLLFLLNGFDSAFAAISPAELNSSYSSLCETSSYRLYVAPTGNDANSGSSSSPFRTIQKAASVASAGTTVYVASGTYYENPTPRTSGTSSARICYKSQSKWGAKIVGTQDFVFYNSGSFVDIVGFEVTSSTSNSRIGIYNTGSNVRIIANHVHHLPALNSGSNGGAGIDHGNYSASGSDMIGNVVHDIGNLSAPGNNVHGLYHANRGGKILNNIVYRVESFGIHLWHAATDVQISNNLVFNSGHGMVVGAGDSPGGVTANNCFVTNNILMNNRGYGIVESGETGSNNRYLNNILFGNKTAIYLQTGSQSGTLNSDPQFVQYLADGSGDYHLKSTSPAIDKGSATNAPTSDFEGRSRPQGSGIDIGPYEYAVSTTPTPTPISPSLSVNGSQFAPGAPITVQVSGMGRDATEWIALYRAADPDSAWSYQENWMYLNGTQVQPSSPLASATIKVMAPMEAGSYNIRLFANSGYENRLMVSANFQVVATAPAPDTTAPSVSITSPANGSLVPRGSYVTITANATDNVGVTKVEFYVNGNLRCTDTAASYSCLIQAPKRSGVSRNITTKAYDAAGNVRTSAVVTISTR